MIRNFYYFENINQIYKEVFKKTINDEKKYKIYFKGVPKGSNQVF